MVNACCHEKLICERCSSEVWWKCAVSKSAKIGWIMGPSGGRSHVENDPNSQPVGPRKIDQIQIKKPWKEPLKALNIEKKTARFMLPKSQHHQLLQCPIKIPHDNIPMIIAITWPVYHSRGIPIIFPDYRFPIGHIITIICPYYSQYRISISPLWYPIIVWDIT